MKSNRMSFLAVVLILLIFITLNVVVSGDQEAKNNGMRKLKHLKVTDNL